MNTQSNALPESFDSHGIPPAPMSTTRPMYWSIRRELWENRSIYIAPLAVAAVYMLGFLVSLFWLPRSVREVAAHQHSWLGFSTRSTHCTANVVIVASCSGSRSRFRISRPFSRRRAFRSRCCRCSSSRSPLSCSSSCGC